MEIKPYTPEHVPAVARMNARMKAGGSSWGFYESERSEWIPVQEFSGTNTWREFFVAEDDEGEVRGAYCLKPQKFRLADEEVWIGTWQGPVSEALVDPRFGLVGIMCVTDMQERYGLQFGWGNSERLVALLQGFGWTVLQTPALVRVVRPGNFLREARYLRNSRLKERALDLGAASGLGSIAFPALHAAVTIVNGAAPYAVAHPVDRFGDWADEIWEAAKDHYPFVAIRDQATLNALMTGPGWPHAQPLMVRRDGRLIGWAAVMVTDMENDWRFGNMRVGSVIDSLALPGEEAAVVGAAVSALLERDVDVMFTNYTHAGWRAAFRKSGFLELPGRRVLTVSPDLAERVGAFDESFVDGMHLAPIDADGPLGL